VSTSTALSSHCTAERHHSRNQRHVTFDHAAVAAAAAQLPAADSLTPLITADTSTEHSVTQCSVEQLNSGSRYSCCEATAL
jgi:hypothetical protein